MPVKLYLQFSPSGQYEVSPEKEVIVGRATTCDVNLAHHFEGNLKVVSREHFKIFYRQNEGFILVDMSHNGTQINDDHLTKGKARVLRDRDVVKLAKNIIIPIKIDNDPDVTETIDDISIFSSVATTPKSGLYFDETTSQFVVDGEPIPHEHLTKLEVNLLKYLYDNAGRLCSFDDIAAHVWSDPGWAPGNNTISRAVSNLREKLDQISQEGGDYIQNIRGQGYKMTTE